MSRFEGCRSLMVRPSTRISPAVIVSSPAMVLSSVDLPQPDGPTSTRKPPFSSSRSIPFRISTWPKRLRRPSISRKAMGSSFYGAGHQTAHEIAAGKHVDEKCWQRGDHRGGHVDVV